MPLRPPPASLALLGALAFAACQSTSRDEGGDPVAEEVSTEETGGSVEDPATALGPEHGPWPYPEDVPNETPPDDSGVRVSVQGEAGEWVPVSEGAVEGGVEDAWQDPGLFPEDAVEEVAPLIPEGPVVPFVAAPEPAADDFERVPWEENPRKARDQSRRENKFLLFAFLCTDLGNASNRLRQDLFASQAFHEFARDRLIMTYLDYPRSFGAQPDEIVRERYYRRFKEHFGVHGYPVIVLLDPAGNVVKKIRGYGSRDTAASVLSELEEVLGTGAPGAASR